MELWDLEGGEKGEKMGRSRSGDFRDLGKNETKYTYSG